MKLHERDGVTVLDMGEMEIWDGADLALLRDTLTELILDEDCKRVGVDLTYVKYIPSGFFGMLFDWLEKGIDIWIYTPQPHVKKMLWFRHFFEEDAEGRHVLLKEPKAVPMPPANPVWSKPLTPTDSEDVDVSSIPVGTRN
jgi:hypothetical protein